MDKHLAAAAAVALWLSEDPTSDASFRLKHRTMHPVTLDNAISPRSDGIEIPRKSVVLNDFRRFCLSNATTSLKWWEKFAQM